ncbi:MAG: hypothetical protein Q9161_006389 [Pseudevernia consocians]
MPTDGVEDFWYLLNEPLLNYGSYIVLELYKSALPSSHCQEKLKNPPKYEEAVRSTHMQASQQAPTSQRWPEIHPGNDSSPTPMPGSFSKAPNPSPSTLPKPTNQEDAQLRAHIHSMRVTLTNDPSVLPWSQVAGLASAKARLEEFAASFLHFPHLIAKLRHQSATGILLFGPQGTGKTLLVKAFAKKYNFAFYDIRASAIMSKYMGDSEKFVRELFTEVKENAPAIVLLDECDGLLCRSSMDASMGPSYKLLQNELRNQWSDLIYSKAKVVVVGATNKPHDIDMDGFGRRLSLKLHVDLPNALACHRILEGALEMVRHQVHEIEMVALGDACRDKGLSGFDIDCLVEGLVRKGLREILVSDWFRETEWEGGVIMMPCAGTENGARRQSWEDVEDKSLLSYRPLLFEDVSAAIGLTRPTVDSAMIELHENFANQYCMQEL